MEENIPDSRTYLAEIQRLLLRMGATPNYAGFRQAARAVQLALEQEQRLIYITKCIYPDVAIHFNTTSRAVERNIRTLITVIWKKNPRLLQELAGYSLPQKPSAAEFIGILVAFLKDLSPEDLTELSHAEKLICERNGIEGETDGQS